MPKQSLTQRVTRLLSDVAVDNTVNVKARWQKIVDAGLGAGAVEVLGPMPDADLFDVDDDEAIQYSAGDADATLQIYPVLSGMIDELGLRKALEIDEAVVPMLVQMQENGMLVDREYLSTLSEIFTDTLFDLEHRCHEVVGHRFAVTSPDQVAEVLFDELGLAGGKKCKKKDRYSTNEKTLEALKGQHPIIALLSQHREISKLQSTYVEVLPTLLSPDGRIRMELGLTVIPSGRINCWGGINLQAIPVATELGREIRRCFTAPMGRKLGAVDYSQIELRALAIMSGDEHLLEAFANNIDLHAQTAAEAIYKVSLKSVTFEQRQEGKRVNFQIPYGISAKGLLEQFILSGVTDKDEIDCQRMLDGWYAFYSKVRPWMNALYEEGRLNGYIRDTLSGRILHTPGLRSEIDKVREHTERVCTAWMCQTFAQVIIKLGMAAAWSVWPEPGPVSYLLQVHDELLVEFDEGDDVGDVLVALMTETEMAQRQPIPITAAWHEAENWAGLK